MNKIPKVIHYCWFGGKPLPKSAKKCIASWRKYLPDYEIKRWDESNFDVNQVRYTREAYKAKKYAFVSDYARFLILFNEGGLYFDTDVEVIKPIDDIVEAGPFMGCERTAGDPAGIGVAPGLGIAATPGMSIYKELLDEYSTRSFYKENGKPDTTTIVVSTSNLLSKYGLQDVDSIQEVAGLKIYPKEYFCPILYATREMTITPNTRSIHHYDESWLSWDHKIKDRFFKTKLGGGGSIVNIQRLQRNNGKILRYTWLYTDYNAVLFPHYN
ncbi:MAG: glycosyl transferase [Bacteroidales bacterium]|nr:glycosyl transferase [Bacteroidales bacterium]